LRIGKTEGDGNTASEDFINWFGAPKLKLHDSSVWIVRYRMPTDEFYVSSSHTSRDRDGAVDIWIRTAPFLHNTLRENLSPRTIH
jgi:hypothetical protein